MKLSLYEIKVIEIRAVVYFKKQGRVDEIKKWLLDSKYPGSGEEGLEPFGYAFIHMPLFHK